MLKCYREWRLEKAELRVADIEQSIWKWGFSDTPSEARAKEKRLARAEAKLANLQERYENANR